MKPTKTLTAITTTTLILLIAITILAVKITPAPTRFNGEQAYEHVAYQVSLGPRIAGSNAHEKTISWIEQQLQASGWEATIASADFMGHSIKNVVGRRGEGSPWIILGAHYDTRMFADRDADPALRSLPVPGANDGASGVAILLELARVLPRKLSGEIWLVFFDAEDNGDIPGWDWILGSRAFVENLGGKPDAVVIIDMVGDADLNLYRERNSTPWLVDEIWNTAASLGYSSIFINQPKYAVIDDHTPFLEAGIPAVDIIDFDYPYWHTIADTPDKVSATSLQIIGEVLLEWLKHGLGR
jgi:Zn-dependent M28 family amino/carboxypeptidase